MLYEAKHRLTKTAQKLHLAGLIRKAKLENSSRKESRLTGCHIGSAKLCFISESKWIFHSYPQVQGSDSKMNTDSCRDWFVNRFLPYLEDISIVFSYHIGPDLRSSRKDI